MSMRALLIVNPHATTTSKHTQDVLTQALATEVDLSVMHTNRRGHATELAKQAAVDGTELVVSLGGDGTVNEIVNGLLAEYTTGELPTELGERLPMVGVVPGGSTNVFGRALGLPADPVDATGVLLEAVRMQRVRAISLGLVTLSSAPVNASRWFTFCAGFGIDAEVVHRVERARKRGKKTSGGLYIRQASAQFFSDFFKIALSRKPQPAIEMELPGDRQGTGLPANPGQFVWVLVQNTAPWTYLGERRLEASLTASLDLNLDVMAMRTFGLRHSALSAAQFLLGVPPSGRSMVHIHDIEKVTLRTEAPMATQLDGEYIGKETELIFRSATKAIRIVA